LRGILHGPKKVIPTAWGDVKPGVKPHAKVVGETHSGCRGGRERDPDIGDLSGDLNLEGLDADQIDDPGGVTDQILAAQMEILAENEVSDGVEDTVGCRFGG
jgi:hypothetical protein